MIATVAVAVFLPMLVEAGLARRHERALLVSGGVEPAGDVYGLMRVVYPSAFLAMMAEGALRGKTPAAVFAVGLAAFGVAKLVKWWAMATLGPRWTFRIVVIPGAPRIASGPYRYMRHPNYVGVVGELLGVMLMTRAVATGPIAIVVFGVLLARRIALEERALDAILARK